MHGPSEVCLNLDTLNVDPRLGQPDHLRFAMDSTVASVDASVDCVFAGYTGSISVTAAGTQVDVEFDPALPDQECCTVYADW